MANDSSNYPDYKVDDWADVEHCVYHALVDAPENLTSHRIAHFLSRVAATMIEKELLTTDELETFLHTCRG